eukprot:688644-Ditylum_brightwellii.AAC.1
MPTPSNTKQHQATSSTTPSNNNNNTKQHQDQDQHQAKSSTKMSSPTFNISITPEEIVSTMKGWIDQITKVDSVKDMRCIGQASRKLTSLSKLMNFKVSCHLAELLQEKKSQFVKKRNCHCTLCTVNIKQREVEICADCQELLCN